MIALSGLFCGLILGIFMVWREIRNSYSMPTKEETTDLINKLNRMALDRNNKEPKL